MMAHVSLQRCTSYKNKELRDCIEQSIYNINFDTDLFKKSRIALKPNLLAPSPTENAVTTHKEFFRAVVQVIKSFGGKPVLLESPATASIERVIKKNGYDEIIRDEKITIADTSKVKTIRFEGAHRFQEFEISRCFFDVDLIVNLPKFKTHGITYITGAMKNLFGVIPGLKKGKLHLKASKKDDFSDLLVDLYSCLLYGFEVEKIFLHIMDAVIGMEGQGPGSGGTPRFIGVILASTDAIALDYIVTMLVGLDPNKVRTITSASSRGLGCASSHSINFSGDPFNSFLISNFKPPMSGLGKGLIARLSDSRFMQKFIKDRPVPNKTNCTLCLECMKICPAEAISRNKKKPVPEYDYNKCIRCYCCHEVCPEDAIDIKTGFFK